MSGPRESIHSRLFPSKDIKQGVKQSGLFCSCIRYGRPKLNTENQQQECKRLNDRPGDHVLSLSRF